MGLNDIRNYVIGGIIFSIVIFGAVFLIGSFHAANPSLDTTQLDTFNRSVSISENLSSTVNGMRSNIESTSDNAGPLGWLNTLLGTVWGGLKTLGKTLSFMTVAFQEIGNFFGVPSEIAGLIILIPIVIIVFALIVAIVRANE